MYSNYISNRLKIFLTKYIFVISNTNIINDCQNKSNCAYAGMVQNTYDNIIIRI